MKRSIFLLAVLLTASHGWGADVQKQQEIKQRLLQQKALLVTDDAGMVTEVHWVDDNSAPVDVTDEMLKQLKELPRLKKLAVINGQFTAKGLKTIGELKGLTWLDLGNNEITDSDLRHLAGLKNLGELHLEPTYVTTEGVRRLKKALPKTVIYYDRPRPTGNPFDD